MNPDRPAAGERFRRFRDRLRAGTGGGDVLFQRAGPGAAPAAPVGARTPTARGGRRGRGGEELAVPRAEFSSYHGRPILKPPVWTWEIAGYLFTGGLAAGSSLLAAGGQLTGRAAVRRTGRVAALAAVGASAVLLVKDLGRPERFHHMLRVAKPTSPMSVGTWILGAYGPAAGFAAVAEVAPLLPEWGPLGLARRVLPPVGRFAGLAAAAGAPALGTYTAVLLADTAVPSWHEAYPHLPFVFAGSALASGAGVGLLAVPPAEAGPARRLAVLGAGLELFGAHRVETRLGLLGEPYRTGRPGRLLRAGRALTVVGVAGAVLGRRSRVASALSGVALLAASVATRFGVFQAGVASTRDPKYTVLPQRERLDRRRSAGADG
ncbi:NrfD/PsrC family molybdoenzyme membrane anchor subunit [Micromonospora sp. LOL_024]|uniref:NrfD/PsrC family molybdoenzyme membrane anchor subunit n=1 Tax=Micromonospora sp. LOL_024 TaxID=3345412 RepID=UPI003A89FE9E